MTPKVVLTDKYLKALKPAAPGSRPFVWDAVQPNFGVRITDRAIAEGQHKGKAGNISFYVVRRRPGDHHPINHRIGAFNRDAEPGAPGTLAHARAEARAALGSMAQGVHPREVEAARQREAARRQKHTVLTVSEAFITDHIARLRSARATEALIRREILGQRAQKHQTDERAAVPTWINEKDARWRDRPITSIDRYDAGALIKSVATRSRHQARKVAAAGSGLFHWAIKHPETDYGITQNPFSIVNVDAMLGELPARDRTLTDGEIKDVWEAAVTLAYPFGALVRALMFTGQRLREFSDASWTEIDGSVLTVPGARMKGKTAHAIPLTVQVKAILDECPRFDGFIFTTTGGKRPISGFSKAKARLDQEIALLRKKDGRSPMAAWKIHDIRRTVRTRLSTLGVLPFLAEMVIAHHQSGIHKVYDLHRYDAEKLSALEKWEAAMLEIVAKPQPPANVADLKSERAKRRRP